MRIFDCHDYKVFIRSKIEANSETRGYQGRLAKLAGCQPSFLSQAIRSKIQLLPEHLLNMANHWAMSPLETEYLLVLLQLSRAGTPTLRRWFERKLKALSDEYQEVSSRFSTSEKARDEAAIYYSSWEYSAVHILVAIPAFSEPSRISEHLGVPIRKVVKILAELEKLGLVRRLEGGGWAIEKSHVHLARTSTLVRAHHTGWRLKSMTAADYSSKSELHFTGVFAVSHQDALSIRQTLMTALEAIGKTATSTREEEGVLVLADFLPF